MIKLKCFQCKRNFEVRNYRKLTAKYCSKRCQGISQKGLHSSPNTEFKNGMRASPNTEFKKGSKAAGEGEKHHQWKGEGAAYSSKHKWIYRKFGKANKCENPNCKCILPKRYEWANISNKYIRDISDWLQLCSSCHNHFDRGLIKINNHVK